MRIERVLVVGLGSIGERHLRIARTLLPDARICVLRRQMPDRIPDLADDCLVGLQKAIEFGPQVAVIANPASFHLGTAYALAESGTHLLVEKPLADSAAAVRPLIALCRQRKLVLLTGYNLRFLPCLRQFRTLLHGGLIGRVNSLRCETGQYLPLWRPASDYRLSVSARRALGGGVLLELSHELDYIRWIFGEVESIQASLSHQSSLDIDVEDTAHLIIGFSPSEDGHRLHGSVSLDFFRHDLTRICVAIGEAGSLRWNGITGTVEYLRAEGQEGWCKVFSQKSLPDESYLAEWENFLACVEEREMPLVTGEDGFEVLRIVDAARRASDTKRIVRLKHSCEAPLNEP